MPFVFCLMSVIFCMLISFQVGLQPSWRYGHRGSFIEQKFHLQPVVLITWCSVPKHSSFDCQYVVQHAYRCPRFVPQDLVLHLQCFCIHDLICINIFFCCSELWVLWAFLLIISSLVCVTCFICVWLYLLLCISCLCNYLWLIAYFRFIYTRLVSLWMSFWCCDLV